MVARSKAFEVSEWACPAGGVVVYHLDPADTAEAWLEAHPDFQVQGVLDESTGEVKAGNASAEFLYFRVSNDIEDIGLMAGRASDPSKGVVKERIDVFGTGDFGPTVAKGTRREITLVVIDGLVQSTHSLNDYCNRVLKGRLFGGQRTDRKREAASRLITTG